ncbi:MAG TPA: hypothetical protein VF627_02835 [Abditibacterium sp.]|jgi:hypothetical protein
MKRFSMRETALLMAPVLVIGTLGWWISKRPLARPEVGPFHFQLHLDKPTTLEAFEGAEAVFQVQIKNDDEKRWFLKTYQPDLKLTTPDGEVLRPPPSSVNWSQTMRMPVSAVGINENEQRLLVKMKDIPAGKLEFVFDAIAQTPPAALGAPPLPLKTMRVGKTWSVDRTRIKPINLAALPRQPLILMCEVVVTQKKLANTRTKTPDQVAGEIRFQLNGAGENQNTPFEMSFNNVISTARGAIPILRASWSGGSEKDTARYRVPEWSLNWAPGKSTVQARISGRVSADNRWPLGFQIEPFNFKTVKVGQKLKFKQFPVPPPK